MTQSIDIQIDTAIAGAIKTPGAAAFVALHDALRQSFDGIYIQASAGKVSISDLEKETSRIFADIPGADTGLQRKKILQFLERNGITGAEAGVIAAIASNGHQARAQLERDAKTDPCAFRLLHQAGCLALRGLKLLFSQVFQKLHRGPCRCR
jgi:hypothetical protein